MTAPGTNAQKPAPKTRIVCHRGACHVAPENTLPAAEAALAQGGDMIELDVRQSSDGVLFVMHDATLDRTTDGTGPITAMSAAEIDALDAGRWFAPEFEGTRVPRLDAFLDALKDRAGFYVEVKVARADSVAAVIREAGLVDKVITSAELGAMRASMRIAAPELRRIRPFRIVNEIYEVRERGDSIIEFMPHEITPERLAEARIEGLDVMVYTPEDDEAAFRAAITAEVDYLNIDYPGKAAAIRSELAG